MQIQCPECKQKLNLGQPKPGKYGPTCKHCGKKFAIRVSDSDPPHVAVGRIKPKPESSKPDRTSSPEATQQTFIRPTSKPSSLVRSGKSDKNDRPVTHAREGDTRTDSRVANKTRPGVDETIDRTTDGTNGTSNHGTVRPTVRSGSKNGSAVPAAANGPMTSRPVANSPTTNASEDELEPIPDRFGGYRIIRMLGRGAMGAVYEAKQISLDRIVALKTIRGRMANNPASLARFTREAYAAAQLTHHNVVQIYDFGEDNGKHFFSMEWVRGGPLSELVRDKGALDPKLAAGYALQAARGLQFAHQNGMVHRDVKPANLLVSNEGVVKVADLGLVKIPDQMDPESDVGTTSMSGLQSGTQVTMMGTAVGTPAYMAPEQNIDSASVDHRADIYSLGCSLFYMLTGRPPFAGSVVSEVLEQHANETPPDLVDLNARIPAKLNEAVHRAMAKRPRDRYGSLAEMIGDLETYLGVSKDGSFSPTSEQADQWESIAAEFKNATPMMRLSGSVLFAYAVVCVLLAVVMPFAGIGWLLFAPGAFVTATIALSGNQSVVGRSVREWVSTLTWFDRVVGLLGASIGTLVVFSAGIWLGLLAGLFAGVIAAFAYHMLLTLPSRRSANASVEKAERFVRDLRIDGADEDGLRSFAARYGGASWQGLYESLFGYDSLCSMREQLSSDPSYTGGSTRGGLRDRVSARFRSMAEANQQSRDQERLARIEERGLASQGASAAEAREQAWAMAQAIVANAQSESGASVDAEAAAQIKRERQKAMLAEARSGKHKRKRDRFAIVKFALGAQTRLISGCLLLAIFAIWAQNAGVLDSVQSNGVSVEIFQDDADADLAGQGTSHWSIGLAGLLLCMSSFISGWKMTPFALIATVIILFGAALGVPSVGAIKEWMLAAVIGFAIYTPGILWGEDKQF